MISMPTFVKHSKVPFVAMLLFARRLVRFLHHFHTYRVALQAHANFSAPTFKPAHEARAGQRAALSVQFKLAEAAMQYLDQRSTSELSPSRALR